MAYMIKIIIRIFLLPITGFVWLIKTFINELIDAIKEGINN